MKRLFLIRGVPGAGKSEFASLLESLLDLTVDGGPECVSISADDFMTSCYGDYKFRPELLGYAHHGCLETVHKAMLKGADVIVHNTLTREKEITPYTDLAKLYDYRVISLVVENRHGNQSIHGVPPEKVALMAERFSLKLTPSGRQNAGKIQEEEDVDPAP